LARVVAEQGDVVGAERLYRAALAAANEADDTRGVAVTQLNLAQWLHEQGRAHEALRLGWQAYQPLLALGYEQDAKQAQALIMEVRARMEESAFMHAWVEMSDEMPPAWLVGG
jgi:hypothetical protein